jgi:hypothetical protein
MVQILERMLIRNVKLDTFKLAEVLEWAVVMVLTV